MVLAERLKNALWSVRRQFGLSGDIDRLLPFIVFERKITKTRLEDLFITYPKRVPEDFKSALVARIQQLMRQYWRYRTSKQGYQKVKRGVLFLEDVARRGFEGCRLVEDDIVGFQLELKKISYRASLS